MFGFFREPRMSQLTSFTDNGKYYISTNDTPDNGFETMVFPAQNGRVIDWGELDVCWYESEDDASAGHDEMVLKWNKKND